MEITAYHRVNRNLVLTDTDKLLIYLKIELI